jgi:hypothetical protein
VRAKREIIDVVEQTAIDRTAMSNSNDFRDTSRGSLDLTIFPQAGHEPM